MSDYNEMIETLKTAVSVDDKGRDRLLNYADYEAASAGYAGRSLRGVAGGFQRGDRRRFDAVLEIADVCAKEEFECVFWYYLEGRISEVNAHHKLILSKIEDLLAIFPHSKMCGWQSDKINELSCYVRNVIAATEVLVRVTPPDGENLWPAPIAA